MQSDITVPAPSEAVLGLLRSALEARAAVYYGDLLGDCRSDDLPAAETWLELVEQAAWVWGR